MDRFRIVVGIDPGGDGGIFRAEYNGDRCVSSVMFSCSPDAKETTLAVRMATMGGSKPADLVVVENVSSMPGQGVSSTFTFGTRFGVLQGVIHSLFVPMVLVRSQKWQKDVGIKLDKDIGTGLPAKKKTYLRRKTIKRRSLDLAKETYPDATGIPINIKNADAASIALWGIKFHE